jgi:hypothetical protein
LREALTCHAIHIGNEDEKEEARSEDNEREDRERKEMLTLRPAIYDLPPCGCWRWPRPAVQTIPKGPENKGPGGVAEDTGDATPRPGSPVKAQKKAHIVRCRRGGITPPIDENDDLFGPSIGDSRSEKKARSGAKEEQTATGTSGRAPSPSRAVPLQSPQPLKFINSAMSPSLVPTGARLPHSVVNSPSVTPPPNISTRINQPSSRSETLGPRNESATSTTTDGTEFKGPNESTSIISTCSTEKASGLQTQPATNPRQRSINTSPAEANLPQFGTDNLDPPSDFASVAPSISSEFSGKQTMATSQSGPASADDTSTTASAAGTTATIGTSSSSTAAITATPSTSTGAWSQRNPISSKDAILRALDPGNLPEPKEDEALFLPADADRIWYMGFLREWSKFKEEAIEFWGTRQCHDAFEELKIYPLTPRRASDSDITDESHGSERLHSHFQRGALEVTRKVYNALMETETMEGDHEVFLGDAEDEDLANNDVKWEPSYVVKARDGEDEATRALGQVEYLGGRKDALTWAISKATMNSWGSLRCVLGGFFSPSISNDTNVSQQAKSHNTCSARLPSSRSSLPPTK